MKKWNTAKIILKTNILGKKCNLKSKMLIKMEYHGKSLK